MPELAQKQSQTQSRQFATAAKPDRVSSASAYAHDPFLAPPQVLGNQAMLRLLPSQGIQPKLTVNPPGDRYEQEADRVADTVMRMPAPSMQRQAVEEQDEEAVQTLPLPEPITPLVQRQAEEEEEEPVQTLTVQRQAEEVEEPIQTLLAQRQSIREGETLQRNGHGQPGVPPSTAATIRHPAAGQPIPASVRQRIEPHVGADLSGVRVHTDASATRAANSLSARAFTHRNHIFLNRTESSHDVRLMAHETTHVVQQGAAPVQRQPAISSAPHEVQTLLPDFVLDGINEYARYIPGYTLFTVIIGFNPLTGEAVERNAINLLEGLMGLTPFGTLIFDALRERGILQAAFEWVEGQLGRLNLSVARIEQTLEAAWDDVDLLEGFDYNLNVLKRHFGALLSDVESFVSSLVDHIIELIKEAAIGFAEALLAENRAWALIKKILRYDPLRDEPVEASTVEILEDFLLLIGKEQELEQMRERGTLETTAAWLDTQLGTFLSLLSQYLGLFTAAWEAIQPENLPNLTTNLQNLANQVIGFLQGVWDFATTVAIQVLELIKDALLGWLSAFANDIPGYHLMTVMLGRDVFTQEPVPLTPTNLIRGFMGLIPGGEQQFEQMQQTGVIPEAAARIETLMSALGISWAFVQGVFLGLWNALSIDDLIDPIGAFIRITEQFGEPISRLFTFVTEVVKILIELVLVMMNFPSELIGRIISNALQAFEDIKNDPVGFLINMLQAVKTGFTKFFGNILQHLLGGVTEWLFGSLRDAGIEPPTSLTLESVLDLVMQILGITMDRIWEKLAERIGQENVDRIRGAIDRLTGIWTFVRDVQERGVAAIWEYIESQISNLWDMVMEQARNWIVTRIITQVTVKLLSFLDPTGIMAVVNSFIAFFNAVQSAIEYFREMLMIVDDYVSTIASVAQGAIEPGAAKMEQGLANAIPVAIGFLANQVGLGNIADKIAEIIAGIREVVDRALDWLMDQAVSLGQRFLQIVEETPKEETPESALVKAKVREELAARTKQPFASYEEVEAIVSDVYNKYEPEGLKSLDIEGDKNNLGSFKIFAEASVRDWIGSLKNTPEPGTKAYEKLGEVARHLKPDVPGATGFKTTLYVTVLINGVRVLIDGEANPIITIQSKASEDTENHAEQRFIREKLPKIVARAQQEWASGEKTVVILEINRTPCPDCTEELTSALNALREHKDYLEVQLHIVGLYKGERAYTVEEMENRHPESLQPIEAKTTVQHLQQLRDAGIKLTVLTVWEKLLDLLPNVGYLQRAGDAYKAAETEIQELIEEIEREKPVSDVEKP